MAQVLVRNLDQSTVERLKRRAARSGRSLQAEAKSILENASRLNPASARALADKIRRQLAGRQHTDSALLVAEDRRR
jgi:plasmid stability protein